MSTGYVNKYNVLLYKSQLSFLQNFIIILNVNNQMFQKIKVFQVTIFEILSVTIPQTIIL